MQSKERRLNPKKLQFIDTLRKSVHQTRRVAGGKCNISPSAVVTGEFIANKITYATEIETTLKIGSTTLVDEALLQSSADKEEVLYRVYERAAYLIVDELYGELEQELRKVYRNLYLESRGNSNVLTELSEVIDLIRP